MRCAVFVIVILCVCLSVCLSHSWTVPWGGASNESGVVLKMAIFASFVHCLTNILHTWPHDSFHVMRLSMTLAYFKVIRLFHIKFLMNGV